jgi:hypothetical protein
MIKAISDNKHYIVLYTDWCHQGFNFKHNISWKSNLGDEGSVEHSLGLLTYFFLHYFGKKGTLDAMIARNVDKVVSGIKNV